MSDEGPRDLAARLNFGRGTAARDARIRAEREANYTRLRERLPDMSEDEAHQTITNTAMGSAHKKELRELVVARFGRSFQEWKETQRT